MLQASSLLLEMYSKSAAPLSCSSWNNGIGAVWTWLTEQRVGAPILASEQLLIDAGIEIPDQAEDEVERFKEFLDQINPEDFLG